MGGKFREIGMSEEGNCQPGSERLRRNLTHSDEYCNHRYWSPAGFFLVGCNIPFYFLSAQFATFVALVPHLMFTDTKWFHASDGVFQSLAAPRSDHTPIGLYNQRVPHQECGNNRCLSTCQIKAIVSLMRDPPLRDHFIPWAQPRCFSLMLLFRFVCSVTRHSCTTVMKGSN